MQSGKWLRGAVYFVICLTILAAGLSSCRSSSKDITLAEQAVVQFHSQFGSEQFHTIYTAADEKFRQAGSESDMTTFFQAIHRKLGLPQEPRRLNAGIKWLAGQGTFVMLSYQTKFSEGSGIEHFTWHISDDRALLVGYNIDSKDLILK